ncbi:MAG: AAA family ATPase [Alphaproteobacteria bacterium]
MITFDNILPEVAKILRSHADALAKIDSVVVNRDLGGRVRLIVDERLGAEPGIAETLATIAREFEKHLGSHAYPAERALLWERDMSVARQGATLFSFEEEEFEGVKFYVADRLATESNWISISPVTKGVPRIVFFSIKGGVGRSTALAVTAWSLAQQGKRVLVLDLDLESPGLSSSLLPEDRRPTYGIADWLVEDLVDNTDGVFADMTAMSSLSHDGEIFVVPAHGRDPGEYVAKLGRVWMPKVSADGARESWSQRLLRLVEALEKRWTPDVVLIDSRAGIDEVASACITSLGATAVLLFAIDGDQTWSGYRILLQHWRTWGKVPMIRERLQHVAAMVPELDAAVYIKAVREHAWDLFSDELYDEVPADSPVVEGLWSFDEPDESAPHYPLPIRWHRGFAALVSLHERLPRLDEEQIRQVFGTFLEAIDRLADSGREES